MARFRLKDKHYINVVGIEYEYKEETLTKVKGRNRPHRKVFPVPMYLNPEDEADCNYPGEIIVSTVEDRLHPEDYLVTDSFVPTLDMEPLDEEADAIFAEFKKNHRGEHPIESLSGTYGEQLLEKLSRQIETLGGREAHAIAPVSVAEFERLKSENAALNAKVDAILSQLAAKQERRV